MKITPYVQLTFEDDGKVVELKDQYIVKDSIKFDYNLLKGLDSSSNKMSFQISKNWPYIEKIINSKKDITAQVSNLDESGNKTRLFTGYISNKYNWSVTDHGTTVLDIGVEDVGTRLLKKPFPKDKDLVLKGKMTEVLDTICKYAKVTRADAIIAETKVCMAIKPDQKYQDILKDLMKECLYTYYFDEYGRLALKSLIIPPTEKYTINKENLYTSDGHAIQLSKSVKQYGAVEVKWFDYQTYIGAHVYKDESGKDTAHPHCFIKIPAFGTYPDKTKGKLSNVKATDLDAGKELVYIENVDPEVETIGDVTYTLERYNNDSISVLLKNNSGIEAIVTKLGARADLTVKESENYTSAGDTSFDTNKLETKWIHDQESVSNYANYLANYYNYCNQTYKFYSYDNMQLGNICRLQDETYSGLDTKVILTAKKYTLGGLIEYTATAISLFDIENAQNEEIQYPSIQPGQPGLQGNGVVEIKYHYQVHNSNSVPPTFWEDTIPEFTPVNRYLWSYFTTYFSDGSQKDSEAGVVGVLGIDGEAPVVINPDFNTFTFVADGNGIIPSSELQKMNCVVGATQDNVDLKAVTGPTLNKLEYYLTVETSGITNVVVNGSTVSCTKDSVMTGDTAFIRVITTYKNAKEKEGKSAFVINLTTVNAGKTGAFTAYEYALSDSRTVAPTTGWTNKFPEVPEDKYVWYKQQFVEAGNEIDPNAWSTPRLGEGNITKVYKDLNVVAGQIAFNVTPDGSVHPNSPEGASLVIGSVEGDGYIRMNAKNIIAKGTITADEINTDSLGTTNLKLNNGGSIYSGGFDATGHNPADADGFYIDSEGHLDAVSATLNNAHVEGVLDCRDDKGVVLFTEKGSAPKVVKCTPPSRWSLMDFYNHMPINKDTEVAINGTSQFCRRVEGMDFLVKTFNIYRKGQTASWTAPCDVKIKVYLPGDDQGYAGGRNYQASWGTEKVDDSYHERSYIIDLFKGQVITIRVLFGNIGAPNKPVSISIVENAFYYYSSISGSGADMTYNITQKEKSQDAFLTGNYNRSIKGIWDSSSSIKYTTVDGWANGITANQLYQTDSSIPVYINDQIMYPTSISKSNDYLIMTLAGQPKYYFLLNYGTEDIAPTGWYNIRGDYHIVDKPRGITTDTLVPYMEGTGVSSKSLGSATKKYKSLFVENVFADNISGIDIPGMFSGSFTQGWFTLPNKVMIQWGKYMGPEQHDHNEVIPFKTNFASGYTPMVFLTAPVPDRYQGENTDDIVSITPSNFTLRMSRWKQNVTWIAIGQAP